MRYSPLQFTEKEKKALNDRRSQQSELVSLSPSFEVLFSSIPESLANCYLHFRNFQTNREVEHESLPSYPHAARFNSY